MKPNNHNQRKLHQQLSTPNESNKRSQNEQRSPKLPQARGTKLISSTGSQNRQVVFFYPPAAGVQEKSTLNSLEEHDQTHQRNVLPMGLKHGITGSDQSSSFHSSSINHAIDSLSQHQINLTTTRPNGAVEMVSRNLKTSHTFKKQQSMPSHSPRQKQPFNNFISVQQQLQQQQKKKKAATNNASKLQYSSPLQSVGDTSSASGAFKYSVGGVHHKDRKSSRDRQTTMTALQYNAAQQSQKKPQKLIKVKWMNQQVPSHQQSNTVEEMIGGNGSVQHHSLLTSKEARPVIRQGQHFTQVHLKLKGNSNQSRATKNNTTTISNTGHIVPASQPPQPTLKQKILHQRLEDLSKQANEVYHPENVQESLTSFTDNVITARDQIPGNSQDKILISASSPKPIPASETQLARKSQVIALGQSQALVNQQLHQLHYNKNRQTTPILDFRNNQVETQSSHGREDERRQKIESRLQRLKDQVISNSPEPARGVRLANSSPDYDQIDPKDLQLSHFILHAAQQQTSSEKKRQKEVPGSTPLMARETPRLIQPEEFTLAVSSHQEDGENLKATAELAQHDSFIDGRCSPRDLSASHTASILLNQNQHQNQPQQQRHLAQQQQQMPFTFNELQREDYELLIGDKHRREIVQANQQARRQQHLRNRSELATKPRRRKSKDEVGNITSSSGSGHSGSAPVSQGDFKDYIRRQKKKKLDASSNLDNKHEDTSIGDYEVDENAGNGGHAQNHLQQQISKHSLGLRSVPTKMPYARATMGRPAKNSGGHLLFFESGNSKRFPSNDRSPQDAAGRMQRQEHLFFQQVSPRSYFQNEGTSGAAGRPPPASAQQLNDADGFVILSSDPSTVDEDPRAEMQQPATPAGGKKQLSHSTSIRSQMVPATIVKRQKQPSPQGTAQLQMVRASSSDTLSHHMLSSISVRNFENGKAVAGDNREHQKPHIKMFTANSRTDHFNESKILVRLSLPDQTSTFDRAENVLTTERQICVEPNQTQVLQLEQHRQTECNTDNKEEASMLSRTMGNPRRHLGEMDRSGRLRRNAPDITAVSSPLATMPLASTFRDKNNDQPQPMDSFSEVRWQQIQHQNTVGNNEASWASHSNQLVHQPTTPATPGAEALSNGGYLMSSIGQVADDPSGVCIYEMREFMDEPGASKQISQVENSKRYQLLMQQQRRQRNLQNGNNHLEDQNISYDSFEREESGPGISTNKTNQNNTGQKHARKRQKSLETTMTNFRVSQQSTEKPPEFKIIENEANGEVKLKILRKDAMYVPREVLQDATIFRQVTVLDISNCRIVELEGRIFMQLQNLSKLYAARNQIKYLSGRISECQQLTHINLDCNQLEMIPSEIGLLKRSLIVLKLAQNKLKQLTLSARELSKLEILNISDNCLTELPEGMDDLCNLRELHLSGNALVRFNVLIGRMPKLNKVSLDWFSFLIPNMSATAIRVSQFDIEQVMQEQSQQQMKNGNSSLAVKPKSMMMAQAQQKHNTFFSPQRQQACDTSHSLQQHQNIKAAYHLHNQPYRVPPSNSRLMSHHGSNTPDSKATGGGGQQTTTENADNNNKNVGVSSGVQTVEDEIDEQMLSIASERNNNQKSFTIAAYGNSNTQNNQSNLANTVTGRNLDVFKHLAILVEKSYGNAGMVKPRDQNSSYTMLQMHEDKKGVEFYTFAKDLTILVNGGALPSKDWISAIDAKGRTMLHYAAQKGDMNVIKALVEKGADKTKVDQYQFNPYGLALREEHFEAAMYILRTPSFVYFDVYQGGGTFGSLLHLAVTKMQADQVRVILEHDVSPNIVDQISGDTPLHILMNLYHKQMDSAYEILESLSDFGAEYNMRNRDNWSAFHLAVKRGNISAIKAMLEIAGNKPQKSWLAINAQNPNFVDLDAPGGQNNVTALHLATENNYYDIVDLLFQYKSDLFMHDDIGNTAFTGVTNNLLMIKLLKKEQKAFFNENFKQRVMPKEMHVTNATFVNQAIKAHPPLHDDPILAQHMSGKYSSLKQTLDAVSKQLQQPLKKQQKTVFHQKEVHETLLTTNREYAIGSLLPTEEEHFGTIEPPAKDFPNSMPQIDESSTFFKASDMHKDDNKVTHSASEDASSCQSADLDENKSNLSRRSASPIPGNQYRRQLKEQRSFNNATSSGRNPVKHTKPIRTKSPEIPANQLPSSNRRATVITQIDSRNIQAVNNEYDIQATESHDIQKTVVLRNMVGQKLQSAESPRFVTSPPVFDYAPKNSKNDDYSDNGNRSTNNWADRQQHSRSSLSQLMGKTPHVQPIEHAARHHANSALSRPSAPTKVFMNPKVMPLSSRTDDVIDTQREAAAKIFEEEKLITMLSIQSAEVQEDNKTENEYDIEEGETELEVDEMDRISDTIEPKDSLQRNVREIHQSRQSELTFKLKVDHQKQFKDEMPKEQPAGDQEQEMKDVQDHAEDIRNALKSMTGNGKRQSSVRALAPRRLIAQDVYGASETAEIRLTVNASKNLFGDQSSDHNLHIGQVARTNHSNHLIKQQSATSHPFDATLLGGLQQVRETNNAKKELRLRDQKNSVFFSQSMKQKPRLTTTNKTNAPIQIAPSNITFTAKNTNILQNSRPSQPTNTSGKSLQIMTKTQVKQMQQLQSIISPTAIDDEEGDILVSAIEMPAYQPTVKMTKVISESNYSSQGQTKRVDSVGSQRSIATTTHKFKKMGGSGGGSQLEELLSKKSYHPGSSHKQINSRKILNDSHIGGDQSGQKTFAQSVNLDADVETVGESTSNYYSQKYNQQQQHQINRSNHWNDYDAMQPQMRKFGGLIEGGGPISAAAPGGRSHSSTHTSQQSKQSNNNHKLSLPAASFDQLSGKNQKMSMVTESQMRMPQKPRLNKKQLLLGEGGGAKPYFYKYLPKQAVVVNDHRSMASKRQVSPPLLSTGSQQHHQISPPANSTQYNKSVRKMSGSYAAINQGQVNKSAITSGSMKGPNIAASPRFSSQVFSPKKKDGEEF